MDYKSSVIDPLYEVIAMYKEYFTQKGKEHELTKVSTLFKILFGIGAYDKDFTAKLEDYDTSFFSSLSEHTNKDIISSISDLKYTIELTTNLTNHQDNLPYVPNKTVEDWLHVFRAFALRDKYPTRKSKINYLFCSPNNYNISKGIIVETGVAESNIYWRSASLPVPVQSVLNGFIADKSITKHITILFNELQFVLVKAIRSKNEAETAMYGEPYYSYINTKSGLQHYLDSHYESKEDVMCKAQYIPYDIIGKNSLIDKISKDSHTSNSAVSSYFGEVYAICTEIHNNYEYEHRFNITFAKRFLDLSYNSPFLKNVAKSTDKEFNNNLGYSSYTWEKAAMARNFSASKDYLIFEAIEDVTINVSHTRKKGDTITMGHKEHIIKKGEWMCTDESNMTYDHTFDDEICERGQIKKNISSFKRLGYFEPLRVVEGYYEPTQYHERLLNMAMLAYTPYKCFRDVSVLHNGNVYTVAKDTTVLVGKKQLYIVTSDLEREIPKSAWAAMKSSFRKTTKPTINIPLLETYKEFKNAEEKIRNRKVEMAG